MMYPIRTPTDAGGGAAGALCRPSGSGADAAVGGAAGGSGCCRGARAPAAGPLPGQGGASSRASNLSFSFEIVILILLCVCFFSHGLAAGAVSVTGSAFGRIAPKNRIGWKSNGTIRLNRAVDATLQDALKTARQAVGALGDTATTFNGADKASVAARVAALRRLQAAQKGLQSAKLVQSSCGAARTWPT